MHLAAEVYLKDLSQPERETELQQCHLEKLQQETVGENTTQQEGVVVDIMMHQEKRNQ